MDKSELTRLKELAEATLDAQGDCIWGDSLPVCISARDRFFISAVQPHVVLDLIDEIERLEEDLTIAFQDNRVLKDQNRRTARSNLDLRYRNQQLHEQVERLRVAASRAQGCGRPRNRLKSNCSMPCQEAALG